MQQFLHNCGIVCLITKSAKSSVLHDMKGTMLTVVQAKIRGMKYNGRVMCHLTNLVIFAISSTVNEYLLKSD